MKIFKFVLLLVLLLILDIPIYCQENPVVPKRTPEQEASKQTEKLQQELNLNQEQAKQVYEINLRYAHERQISNKRSEAMERMKNKNAAIEQVLSPEQNNRLQSKRYERTYFETNIQNRNQTTNPSNLRSSTNFRSGQSVRVPANQEMNNRNNNRPVNPDFRPGMQQGQSIRRSTTTAPPFYQNQNSSSSRSSSAPGYTPRRPETTIPSPNNSTGNQRQTTPATSSGRSNPDNSNRK
jgi:hypothetical protein